MAVNQIDAANRHSPQGNPVAPVLVLGIGNILMTDDGVGVRVVERLKTKKIPPHVEIVDGGTTGFDLWSCLSHRQKIVVVDAVDMGAPPGYVCRRYDLPDATDMAVSVHDLHISSLIKIAGCMAHTIPPQLVVVAVQPRAVIPGMSLSCDVEAHIEEAVSAVLDEVTDASKPAAV